MTTQPVTVLAGHGAVWGAIAPVRARGHLERIAMGAFTDGLVGCDVRASIDHDHRALLGRLGAGTLMVAERPAGLAFAVPLPHTSFGDDVAALVRRRDIKGASVAFRTTVDEWQMLGRDQLRTVLQARLSDLGPSLEPVYDATHVALRSLDAWPTLPTRADLDDPLTPVGERSAPTSTVEVRGESVNSWARYVVVAHVPPDRHGPSRVRLFHTDSPDQARSVSEKASEALEMRSTTCGTDPKWSVTVRPGAGAGGVTVRSLVKEFLS